jgi:hypothetical protein
MAPLAAMVIRSRIGRVDPPPVRAGPGIGTAGSATAAAACSSSASVVVVMTVTGSPRWVPRLPDASAVRIPHANASCSRWDLVRVSVDASTTVCSDSGR